MTDAGSRSTPGGSSCTLHDSVQTVLVEYCRFAAVDDTHNAACTVAVRIVDIPHIWDNAALDCLLINGLVEQTDAGIVLFLNRAVRELTPVGTILTTVCKFVYEGGLPSLYRN